MDKRQAVINKLKAEPHKVKCPKCKCEEFLKKTIEKCSINVNQDSIEDDYIEYVDTEDYRCAECNYKLKDKDFE